MHWSFAISSKSQAAPFQFPQDSGFIISGGRTNKRFLKGLELPCKHVELSYHCIPTQSALRLQVAKSVEYVSSGTTALVEAKRLQKSTRKLMCIGLIIVVIIIIIIVIVIVKPWNK